MSHHTPEDLRHILLLLKGKQKLGKGVGKLAPEIRRVTGRPLMKGGLSRYEDMVNNRESGGDASTLEAIMQMLASASESKQHLRARGVGR